MDIYLLAIQARVLMWTGIGLLATCLWLGISPYTAAWRAAVAACVAMWCARWLCRQIANVIEERAAVDMAERQTAEEQVAATAAAAAAAAEEKENAAARSALRPAANRPAGAR